MLVKTEAACFIDRTQATGNPVSTTLKNEKVFLLNTERLYLKLQTRRASDTQVTITFQPENTLPDRPTPQILVQHPPNSKPNTQLFPSFLGIIQSIRARLHALP